MNYQLRSVFIGWDPREADAYAVARMSAKQHMTQPIPVNGLILDEMIDSGLYKRPFEFRDGPGDRKIMWDIKSDAPQSTQHANSRFFIPFIAAGGWAMFMDGDVLVRGNITRLFDKLDPQYALYCVKHKYEPTDQEKMDGQVQSKYSRKNWSSVMIWNVDHEAHNALTLDMLNTSPGRDLHRFCWLDDSLIGELDASWNWLVGHSDKSINPNIVHFTEGTPSMAGHENAPYAKEWRQALNRWAS